MPKVNIRESDPVRYAAVRAEQDAMRRQYRGGAILAKLCPYCTHRIEMIQSGAHGASFTKCPNCGEEVFFPPISFRIAR